jgi:hypothetical protein
MTVQQLIVVLQQFRPDRRVLVPGQEFGMADVGDVQSRRFSSWHGGDDAMGIGFRICSVAPTCIGGSASS